MLKRCVTVGCSNVTNLKEFKRRHFPSKIAILRRRSSRSQEKEEKMVRFCSTEANEMAVITIFSALFRIFQA